jgi:hypothetical protein
MPTPRVPRRDEPAYPGEAPSCSERGLDAATALTMRMRRASVAKTLVKHLEPSRFVPLDPLAITHATTGSPGTGNGAVPPATPARAVAKFGPWSRSVSVASSAPVRAMDADVMITIAFCLEVVLFALAGGILVLHEIRKARAETAAAWRGGPDFPRPSAGADHRKAADTARLVTGPSPRGIRDGRSVRRGPRPRRRERTS